jgi:hypothetical protein
MRLIDADRLKEVFDRNVVSAGVWNEIIDNQPTAYDVGKVVGKLKESDFYIDQEQCITVEDAINIVKGGLEV